MKYFYQTILSIAIIISLIIGYNLFSGVNHPKFKVGDCIEHNLNPKREPWDSKKQITAKILEIGNSHYRLSQNFILNDFQWIDDQYHLINCKDL